MCFWVNSTSLMAVPSLYSVFLEYNDPFNLTPCASEEEVKKEKEGSKLMVEFLSEIIPPELGGISKEDILLN